MSAEMKDDDAPGWQFAGALPSAHDADIRAIVVARADVVVTGGRDNSLRSFGLGGESLGALRFDSWVMSLAPLDAERIVAGLQDGTIRVVVVPPDGAVAETALWTGHSGPVCSLSTSAVGALCVSGSWDETARCWDRATGACVQTLGGHENNVAVLATRRGDAIVSGSSGQ